MYYLKHCAAGLVGERARGGRGIHKGRRGVYKGGAWDLPTAVALCCPRLVSHVGARDSDQALQALSHLGLLPEEEEQVVPSPSYIATPP